MKLSKLIESVKNEAVTHNPYYGLFDEAERARMLNQLNELYTLLDGDIEITARKYDASFDALIDQIETLIGNDFSDDELDHQSDLIQLAIALSDRYTNMPRIDLHTGLPTTRRPA